ncbi:hypothetical protein EUTSA_v10029372mg [Eutrema salsugineum]|uniref:F-box domain-containing protein n=1 Tax=Eutrema salsugineum TaxID=72664 RepID=V4L7F1_EUTSA|nr:hypothetical protein EUTSA_v10029372mg [Eutrema salsugineum]
MSSLEKKKRKMTTTPNPSLLPDDLLLCIFARISRLYYPTLSLVSKSFRSLLSSPELYETRSLLRRPEICLYVCLQFPSESNPRWFTLCPKPNQTLSNTTSEKKSSEKKSSGYVLANIPLLQSPLSFCPSSRVSILDCRYHTWHDGPSLQRKRMLPSASVVDGKIYVGGYKDEDSDTSDSIEVLDPSSQVWDLVPNDYSGWNWDLVRNARLGMDRDCSPSSACIDGKFHLLLGSKGLTYDPKKGKWSLLQRELSKSWFWSSPQCTIEDVLYCYDEGMVKWYNTKFRLWEKVKGLQRLPTFAGYAHVELADYGGKMAVLWYKYVPSSGYKKKMIWCAVISLERRSSQEVLGMVEWCDAVLLVPRSYEFVRALAATV